MNRFCVMDSVMCKKRNLRVLTKKLKLVITRALIIGIIVDFFPFSQFISFACAVSLA